MLQPVGIQAQLGALAEQALLANHPCHMYVSPQHLDANVCMSALALQFHIIELLLWEPT